MASKQSTRSRKNLQLVPKEADWEQIQSWARTAIASGIDDKERQHALLLLLDEMTRSNNPASIALLARNAAFGNAESIIDDVIDQALAPLRGRRAS